jgi:hypothetical protein
MLMGLGRASFRLFDLNLMFLSCSFIGLSAFYDSQTKSTARTSRVCLLLTRADGSGRFTWLQPSPSFQAL